MRILWFVSNTENIDAELTSNVPSVRLRCLIPARTMAALMPHWSIETVDLRKISTADYSQLIPADIAIFGKVFYSYPDLYEFLSEHNIPMVMDLCDDIFNRDHLNKPYQLLASYCGNTVASCPTLAEQYLQYSGKTATVIYDAVEGSLRAPSANKSIDPDTIHCLWYGIPHNLNFLHFALPKLSQLQGIKLKITVLTQIDDEIKDWYRSAKNDYQDRITLEVKQWNLEDHFQQLQRCDVVLVPSMEGEEFRVKTANRIITALWAGKPCIAYPLPSYQDFKEYAILNPSMADGIRHLLTLTPQQLAAKISAGQEYIKNHYSTEQISQHWINLIQKLTKPNIEPPAKSPIKPPKLEQQNILFLSSEDISQTDSAIESNCPWNRNRLLPLVNNIEQYAYQAYILQTHHDMDLDCLDIRLDYIIVQNRGPCPGSFLAQAKQKGSRIIVDFGPESAPLNQPELDNFLDYADILVFANEQTLQFIRLISNKPAWTIADLNHDQSNQEAILTPWLKILQPVSLPHTQPPNSDLAHTKNLEIHLLIIWHNAINHADAITKDLQQHPLQIHQVYEINWSEQNFENNLSRFYGKKLPSSGRKIQMIGQGPFLLFILQDLLPQYGYRNTSKGVEYLNTRLFDLKQKYRALSGGGDKIHCTNSIDETRHDIQLLLHTSLTDYTNNIENLPRWTGQIQPYQNDLLGAQGWQSLAQLFDTLNQTIDYVVLRNFSELPLQHDNAIHGDIDLLVEDFEEALWICNGRLAFSEANRVHILIQVDGQDLHFDLRYLGDNYYPPRWQKNILDNRVFNPQGFFTPDPVNHFYSLIYHAVIHKRMISQDYQIIFKQFSKLFGITPNIDSPWNNRPFLKSLLDRFMLKNQYQYCRPIDPSVNFLLNESDASSTELDQSITHALETISAETPLYYKKNQFSETQVWKTQLQSIGSVAIKRVKPLHPTASSYIVREHEFIKACNHPQIVKFIAHGAINGDYFIITQWIEGYVIQNEFNEFKKQFNDVRQQEIFLQELENIISHLKQANIKHRDIWEKNIIISQGRPVLFDFSWAVWQSEPKPFTPSNLKQAEDDHAINYFKNLFNQATADLPSSQTRSRQNIQLN